MKELKIKMLLTNYYSVINKNMYILGIKQKDASCKQSHWSVRHLESYESRRGRTQSLLKFYSEK